MPHKFSVTPPDEIVFIARFLNVVQHALLALSPRPRCTANPREDTCDDMFRVVRHNADKSANIRRALSNGSFALDKIAVNQRNYICSAHVIWSKLVVNERSIRELTYDVQYVILIFIFIISTMEKLEKCNWTDENCLKHIQFYQDRPILWDPQHPEFKKKKKKKNVKL
jgi:hypothetical protein